MRAGANLDGSRGDRNRPVLVETYVRRRRQQPNGLHHVGDSYPPVGAHGPGLGPVARLSQRRLHRLANVHVVHPAPGDQFVAVLEQIVQAEIGGIDSELPRQHVHVSLESEVGLNRPVAAHTPVIGIVGVDRPRPHSQRRKSIHAFG